MSASATKQKTQIPDSHDAAVYELDEIWDSDWFPQSDHRRIRDLVSIVPAGAASLLDVGCGNGLFINTLNKANSNVRPSRLYAADRSLSALKHVEVEHCRCDISDLPFSDDEFEIVTCLEVVEHLPLAVYTAALSELSRVAARWIMISVPFELNLNESLCQCPSCATRFNPDYHLRSFNAAKLRDLFREKGYAPTGTHFLGSSDEYVGYHRIRRIFNGEFLTTAQFPAFTICPMCGYSEPDALAGELARRRRTSENARPVGDPSRLRKLASRLWPKRRRHTWIAVLFEKSSHR